MSLPVDITVCGRAFKVRALPVLRLIEMAEQYVTQQRIRNVQTMAAGLPEADRGKFLQGALDNMPMGKTLETAALDILSGKIPNDLIVSIIVAALVDKSLTRADVEKVFEDADVDELLPLLRLIRGTEKKSLPSTDTP